MRARGRGDPCPLSGRMPPAPHGTPRRRSLVHEHPTSSRPFPPRSSDPDDAGRPLRGPRSVAALWRPPHRVAGSPTRRCPVASSSFIDSAASEPPMAPSITLVSPAISVSNCALLFRRMIACSSAAASSTPASVSNWSRASSAAARSALAASKYFRAPPTPVVRPSFVHVVSHRRAPSREKRLDCGHQTSIAQGVIQAHGFQGLGR